MIYALAVVCVAFAGWVILAGVRAYNRERPGKPDLRKIERLEIELGIIEAPRDSVHEIIKDIWAQGRPEPGPLCAITRDLTDAEAKQIAAIRKADKAMNLYIRDCHFGP